MSEAHKTHRELGPGGRVVAVVLAVVWTAGGGAGLLLAFVWHQWLGLVLGPLAIAYGALWVQVARSGRRLEWRRQR